MSEANFNSSPVASVRALGQMTGNRLHKKSRAAGFISVELGLALLAVTGLIVGAVIFFLENTRKNSINLNTQYIQSIAGSAQTTFGQRNQYGSMTTAIAVQSRIIPDALRDAGANTATNPYGSAITIAPANGTGTNDTLNLTWGNVPRGQCTDLVVNLSSMMRGINVGATAVKVLDQPLNYATAVATCDSAEVQTITFRIGRG